MNDEDQIEFLPVPPFSDELIKLMEMIETAKLELAEITGISAASQQEREG